MAHCTPDLHMNKHVLKRKSLDRTLNHHFKQALMWFDGCKEMSQRETKLEI